MQALVGSLSGPLKQVKIIVDKSSISDRIKAMIKAKMNDEVKLLGTSLRLAKDQEVSIVPATNLPHGGFFAAPVDGSWGEDSIHVDAVDFRLEKP